MSGWTTKKLGEVCEEIRERISSAEIPLAAYITTDNMLKNCAGVCEAENLPPKICSLVAYQSGDILLSNIRPYLKKIWLADRSGGASSDVIVLRPRFENILARYIYRALAREEFFDFSMLNVTGTKMPRGKRDWIKSFEIPIPPLAEQKRIVAKIDAAFEKIDRLKTNAEKNLANAKELFQSALDEAMRPKRGWVEKRLGEVANIRVGPFGSSLHKADYVDNGVPLVNPCHMKDSKIADRISTQVSHDKAESLKEYRLKAGDIVFARRGEIGRLAFVSEKEDGYLCGTGSLFARFRERYDIQFLYFFFSSKSFVERLELLSTGTTMKSINSSALESMSFSVPPMNDQQRLAKQLDSLSQKTKALQQNYVQQIADCAEMRQAILREAFEGRL